MTKEKAETPLEIAEERRHTDIVALLLEAAGEELPDNVKIQRLSEAMYKEDVEEAKKEFSKLLGSLSPELVSSKKRSTSSSIFFNIFTAQVTCTAVNSYGSVLQDAVLERKTDFIRILLDHG